MDAISVLLPPDCSLEADREAMFSCPKAAPICLAQPAPRATHLPEQLAEKPPRGSSPVNHKFKREFRAIVVENRREGRPMGSGRWWGWEWGGRQLLQSNLLYGPAWLLSQQVLSWRLWNVHLPPSLPLSPFPFFPLPCSHTRGHFCFRVQVQRCGRCGMVRPGQRLKAKSYLERNRVCVFMQTF